MEHTFEEQKEHWLDKPITSKIKLNRETLIIGIIILAAIVSRLYNLGARVMSHDEINHVYFAYQFFQGGKYVHNPITHGPFQFHVLELSYFLFNDSDFTARLPAAFFSILTVIFLFKFRRYLGKNGAITAAALFVISPFMLYYGRYARNEAIAIFLVIATLWSVLRYLDTGENKYIYISAVFTALHYTTKETVFIFTAQLLIFIGLLFLYRISKIKWGKGQYKKIFFILLLIAAIALFSGFLYSTISQPEIPAFEETPELPADQVGVTISLILYAVAGLSFAVGFGLLIVGYGWSNLVQERTFGILVFQLSLVIPQLAAFPAFWLKIPMTQYENTDAISKVAIITVIFVVISILLGAVWKSKEWLIGAGIFYGIFFLFYTSIFSNLSGIYSGLITSLGYWLEQQGVERGSQPWYYFLLIELPIYEYLAVLGSFITGVYSIVWISKNGSRADSEFMQTTSEDSDQLSVNNSRRIALGILLFYSVTSIFAYIAVGEKMPWLTVHTSWSMWMLTGWLIGKMIDKIDWQKVLTPRGLLVFLAIFISILSFLAMLYSFLQPISPFAGKDIDHLQATYKFLLFTVITAISILGANKITSTWQTGQLKWVVSFSIMMLLAFSTARHAFIASYINYDNAKEYLVYAHAASGPKDALKEIESISTRLTGGKDIMIGFDNHTAYPFWWYLRDYPNRLEFGETPTRELRNYSIILVGDQNYYLIDPIVRDDFISFEYMRMVWPNQDYFDLGFYQRYLSDPATRKDMLNALLQVWLNRDFSLYGDVTGENTSLTAWNPGQHFRMYVRKDVAAQIWQYGATADYLTSEPDPYAEGMLQLSPAMTIKNIDLNAPKGIAAAPNGDVYVADTDNNRIVQIASDGGVIRTWGQAGDGEGDFNQPWGIVVSPDNYVYVADTWNHRIQKFTSDGEFITTWGSFGQAETGYAFWGPRDVAIDAQGNVLVTDTGNKRIVVFSPDGEYITEFGSPGYQAGQLDEPVGIAVSPVDGMIYVADTWNQRVQVFSYAPGIGYFSTLSWDISGWEGQSLDNKPFLTVDDQNRVIVVDPETARVLVFNSLGEFINGFGQYDPFGTDGYGFLSGVAPAPNNGLWVVDSTKNAIYYFILAPGSVE